MQSASAIEGAPLTNRPRFIILGNKEKFWRWKWAWGRKGQEEFPSLCLAVKHSHKGLHRRGRCDSHPPDILESTESAIAYRPRHAGGDL
jgi:hypothetical protein